MSEAPITKRFDHSVIGDWSLCGHWNVVFGYWAGAGNVIVPALLSIRASTMTQMRIPRMAS
jgi:hypothetical protein